MSDLATEETRDELVTMLALLGQTGGTRGPRPSLLEMKQLARGDLTEARRAEVESHLAHDPHALRALINANPARVAGARSGSVWRGFLRPWSLAATGVACAMLAVLFLTTFDFRSGTPRAARHAQVASNSVPSEPQAPRDWRRRIVRYGYEHPSALDRMVSSSGDALAGHCEGADCNTEIDALTELGAALGTAAAECLRSSGSTAPLPGAPSAASRVQAAAARISDPVWRSQASRLTQALQRPAREACPSIRSLQRAIGSSP